MNYNYKCVAQSLTHEDLGQYTTYGIALENDIMIPDVSSDKLRVLGIISTLNRLQVSPVHLRDVVTDMISA